MISIVILTANRRPLLERVLVALAHGTLRPDEVVVVNNQSADDTVAFLARAEYPFTLRVIEGPGRSFADSRNAGVEATRGEWVVFLDDDCEADRYCLERLAGAMRLGCDAAGGSAIPAEEL
jgi:glycosyltransferase involved in cell wall biosynthesis